MNAVLAGLVGMVVILFGGVAFLYVRLRNVAGPRERAFLDRMVLLSPAGGIAFGFLLWLVADATHASGGIVFAAMSPVFLWLPAILLGRRLRQLRKEDAAS